MKPRKTGTVAANRIPIYDHKGRMRGHAGPHMSEAGVARFTRSGAGAKLTVVNGRKAWVGNKPTRGE
jgi:hypothetical protein